MNIVQVRRHFLYRTTQKIVEWLSKYRVMSEPFQGMQYSPENIVGNALHYYNDLPFRCPRLLSKWFLHVGSDRRSGIQDWFLLTPN